MPVPDARVRAFLAQQIHMVLLVVWALLTIPTLLWWGNSIRWVLLISIYANMAGHWSAWEGKRAAHEARNSNGTGLADSPGQEV